MKKRQHYWVIASFAFLLFVMLGYVVKFYPEALRPFDTSVQSTIRGNLPQPLTAFFKTITVIGNPSTQAIIAAVAVIILWLKKWYAEAIYVATNSILAGICIVSLKYIYQRPRPSITHLVYASGNSFPSGHATGTFLIIGSILVICFQRLSSQTAKWTVAILLGLLIFCIALSRIYLGVHYPSDILGGFLLAYAIHNLVFPYYDQLRFKWRFRGKQK